MNTGWCYITSQKGSGNYQGKTAAFIICRSFVIQPTGKVYALFLNLIPVGSLTKTPQKDPWTDYLYTQDILCIASTSSLCLSVVVCISRETNMFSQFFICNDSSHIVSYLPLITLVFSLRDTNPCYANSIDSLQCLDFICLVTWGIGISSIVLRSVEDGRERQERPGWGYWSRGWS